VESGEWGYQADVAVEFGLLGDPAAVPALHKLLMLRPDDLSGGRARPLASSAERPMPRL
jgi:hypothetical protein